MSQPQLSDDGRHYWDGHTWHLVPRVDLPPVEAAVPEDFDLPHQGPAMLPAHLADTDDVGFGTGIVVDNAALRTVNAGRDTAYVLTFLLAVLAAFGPTAWSLYRTTDAHLPTVASDLWGDTPPHSTLIVPAALLVLLLLRGFVHVRLFTGPSLQAFAAVVVASTVTSLL